MPGQRLCGKYISSGLLNLFLPTEEKCRLTFLASEKKQDQLVFVSRSELQKREFGGHNSRDNTPYS